MEEIELMQEKLDHRTEIEKEAEKLIVLGKYKEAQKLLELI